MSSDNNIECCFRGCFDHSSQADFKLLLYAAGDDYSEYRAHEKCFYARRDPAVLPDNPEEHGRIPKDAKCVFCGMKLPVFGKHPYCFDAGDFSPPQRYWAHNQCLKASLKVDSLSGLPF